MRKIRFKVVYWNDMADRVVTLFSTPDYSQAEYFAEHYDGEQQEVFIKKVWVWDRGAADGQPSK